MKKITATPTAVMSRMVRLPLALMSAMIGAGPVRYALTPVARGVVQHVLDSFYRLRCRGLAHHPTRSNWAYTAFAVDTLSRASGQGISQKSWMC